MKWLSKLLLVLMIVLLTGCKQEYDVAFIYSSESTNAYENDDIMKAIVAVADQEESSYLEYEVNDYTVDALKSVINDAVSQGVKLFIFNGDEFSESFSNVHYQYVDEYFVLFNGNIDASLEIDNNAYVNNYDYNLIGFVSGYSFIAEGYTDVTFLSDVKNAERSEEAIGFIAGVNYASIELDVPIETLNISFIDDDDELMLEGHGVYLSGNLNRSDLNAITDVNTRFILSSQVEKVADSNVLASTYKEYITIIYNIYKGVFIDLEEDLDFIGNINTNDFGLDFTLGSYNKVNPVSYEEIKSKVVENSLEVPDDYDSMLSFFANQLIDGAIYPSKEAVS